MVAFDNECSANRFHKMCRVCLQPSAVVVNNHIHSSRLVEHRVCVHGKHAVNCPDRDKAITLSHSIDHICVLCLNRLPRYTYDVIIVSIHRNTFRSTSTSKQNNFNIAIVQIKDDSAPINIQHTQCDKSRNEGVIRC
ncbi:unnamed protein product [Albugo candida]|uniref:Uncharacterized protein n=1 Tax=Albugo candida TaxID=65357 RepID=A0A024GAM1_9STRA|nr:unnamed protein product [Albugo candida]|eukprot:CCI43724.1 unnamed protein product [Albugo candida]